MSRMQEEEPQTASRRPSLARAVAPRRSEAAHGANVSVTKTKARSKKVTDASSNDQKQWHIDLLKKWLEPGTVAFFIIFLVNLVVGIIIFAKTGNTSIVCGLIPYVIAFIGVPNTATKLKDIFRG
jgi:hypothetical protein